MKATNALLMAVTFCVCFTSLNSALAQTWIQTSAPSNNWWCISSSADGAKLIAATANGLECQIYTSTNSGLDWISNSAVAVGDACVASSADGTVLAVIGVGGVSNATESLYISTNSGASWTCASKVTNEWWASVAVSADGRKLVASGEIPEEIITSTNFGATWKQQIGTPVLTGQSEWGPVASSADGTKLAAAVYNGGPVFISTDSGVTWVSNMYNRAWVCVASSADGRTLGAGSASEFLVNVYTNYASIYTSTNSGATWTTNVFPDSAMVLSIACSADGRKIRASVGDYHEDAILLSTNSGAT